MPRYAYKGVDSNMHTCCGGGFTFELNKWYEEETAQTVASGFHCANNPLTCLSFFSADTSRFFIVEVAGDVNENDQDYIACTKIRFVKELSLQDLVAHAIKYICNHPKLPSNTHIVSESFKATSNTPSAIVRGKNPCCSAKKGTLVGLLKEKPDSVEIAEANLYLVDGRNYKENVYYLADGSRKKKKASAEG